jgi:hypothetical protein
VQNKEQRTENKEQRTNNERMEEQRTENREQRTENREQRTNNERTKPCSMFPLFICSFSSATSLPRPEDIVDGMGIRLASVAF